MADRNGIEIDFCPECRGVWLDRGELDKIIERSARETHTSRPSEIAENKSSRSKEDEYRYKKKKGLFGELFDF
jgi:hypothetical protein